MTDNQINASRENGAKSHGPVTPEGKQRSWKNAIKHGLCTRSTLLPDESEEEFHQLKVYWMRQLQPLTLAERDRALNVVYGAWGMRRNRRFEAGTLSIEMEKFRGDRNAGARAFTSLAQSSRVLDLVNRYCSRARRDFEHALKIYCEVVDRRRAEESRDKALLSPQGFEKRYGKEPDTLFASYYGKPQDKLPNEPEMLGVYPFRRGTPPPQAA